MPECRYCGKWYRNNKALKTHITKVHTMNMGIGGRSINPMTFDPLGKMARREKRRRKR